ncbi:hypothetical protein RND71_005736 [Anisodus tanguticus]|uniref:Uncharacterized protein n=1 Tax=Anisodus tanguticus TaxID=243964 RepID=A0AAE1SQN5_9SOLA|nr:hypothetical protein RND71_005736 [Anisodus tanguticus]
MSILGLILQKEPDRETDKDIERDRWINFAKREMIGLDVKIILFGLMGFARTKFIPDPRRHTCVQNYFELLSVEKLRSSGLCASTFEGSWISKTWGSRVGHINVEDFADRSQNVARAVGAAEVKKIYIRIQLSVQYIFDFLNKKIEGNSLRKFLFGQDVASKIVTAGTVNYIAKEIQACASGEKEFQSVDCSKEIKNCTC